MGAEPAVTFGAVGDVCFAGAAEGYMRKHGLHWPFERVQRELARADLLFGNMESVMLPPEYPKEKADPRGLVSKLDGPASAALLKSAGFDFMNLAANHVLDAGTSGLFYTQECLRAAGLKTGGVGRTQEEARALQVAEAGGLRFGFLCYCEDNNYALSTTGPCHAYYTLENVIADVRKNRERVDVLVVSIHADLEFMETPAYPRYVNARRIAEAGASVVLEHHPHVPQGIEMHAGCLIAYSLGNFFFPPHSDSYLKSNGPHTAHSFILLMQVGRAGVRSFERVPLVVPEPPEERPCVPEGAARAELLAYFGRLDAMLKDEALLKRKWREKALAFLGGVVSRLPQDAAPEILVRTLLPRMLLVAENRAPMEEILELAREAWASQASGDNTFQRPSYRLDQVAGAAKKEKLP